VRRARYHPAARDELRGAIQFDEDEHPGRGTALEQAVRQVVRRVQVLPGSAPRWTSTLELEIRRAKVKRHPYLVVYMVLPEQIVILAVAHTSKTPGYWSDRIGA
jgi:plasmid stabilization system protein ParE